MSDPVRYPQMRDLLRSALTALADPAFQRRAWIDRQLDPVDPWHHDIDQVVHAILDDQRLHDDPLRSVGDITRSQSEAIAVGRVATLVDELLDKHGPDLTDAEYVGTAGWPAIVEAARVARAALNEY